MRKLIRKKDTLAFLTDSGEWTMDQHIACDFLGNEKASDPYLKSRLENVEWCYVFDYENKTYDFTMPFCD